MSDSSPNAASSHAMRAEGDVVGRMAGEYRLLRKLGEGGFGSVYEAEHPVLRRRAAVKVLHRVAGMDSDAVLRFISEAQAANQIRSRHIVDVFSFGKLPNGRHFYVMDLLDGEPLDRLLRREERLEVVTALQLLRPIAEALDSAHAAGVVHRDLKPQNVFLAWEPSGETVPKLLDFGMAKLLGESSVQTVSGVPIGTPLYMSPEQARDAKVDGRSDVYALGVLCHELLTGRVPFTGESPLAVLVSHLTVEPPRASEVCPGLPVELDAPLLAMLQKEPSGRPATAGEAVASLVRAAERAGLVVPPGMPRLARPCAPPRELPASPPAGEPPQLALGATEPAPERAGARWPLFAAAVAIVAAAGYLGQSTLEGPSGSRASWLGASPMIAPPEPAEPESAEPATPPDQAAPTADVPPEAAASVEVASTPGPVASEPAAPERVELLLRGAPPGARVSSGDTTLGAASEPLGVPYGTEPIELTVSAPGHESETLRIVPDRPRQLDVKLRRRAARPRPEIPSDLEDPF